MSDEPNTCSATPTSSLGICENTWADLSDETKQMIRQHTIATEPDSPPGLRPRIVRFIFKGRDTRDKIILRLAAEASPGGASPL